MKTTKTLLVILGILVVLAIKIKAQSFLTNGLVDYYPFSGNAVDVVGTNNGTIQGATLTTDRFNKSNAAYYFDGSSWIETPQYRLLDGASNATISAWVVINPGTHGEVVASGDARSGHDPIHLSFAPETADVLSFQNTILDSGIGTLNTSEPLPNLTAGVWHQIVVVLSTNNPLKTLTIYVDGEAEFSQVGNDEGTGAFTKIAYDTDMRFLIGAMEGRPVYSSPGEFWSGKIDDIRIYNRDLSQTEVQQLYAIESPPIINIQKAVYLTSNNLWIGSNYQLQTSSDLISWTNHGSVFNATNKNWQSTNYWNVDDWNQFFFRLQLTP